MAFDQTTPLIERAVRGETDARASLMERLRPRLVLWAASRLSRDLREKLEPEDVAQEVLLAVHRGLDDFRGEDAASFFGWLFRLAENRIRDQASYFGAKKRQPTAPWGQSSQVSPSTEAHQRELLAQVRDTLSSLPADQQAALRLVRLEDRSVADAAEILDRSENAVRVLYCRALKGLRERLAAR